VVHIGQPKRQPNDSIDGDGAPLELGRRKSPGQEGLTNGLVKDLGTAQDDDLAHGPVGQDGDLGMDRAMNPGAARLAGVLGELVRGVWDRRRQSLDHVTRPRRRRWRCWRQWRRRRLGLRRLAPFTAFDAVEEAVDRPRGSGLDELGVRLFRGIVGDRRGGLDHRPVHGHLRHPQQASTQVVESKTV
jgi:hypothetical protein